MSFTRCDCRERITPAATVGKEKECCFIKSQSILETIEPKCNIQKESKMLKQPQRQVINIFLLFKEDARYFNLKKFLRFIISVIATDNHSYSCYTARFA